MLEERTAQRFTDVDVDWWINEAVGYIAGMTRCLRATATTASTADIDSYATPASAIASWAITQVTYDGGLLEETPFEKRKASLKDGKDLTASAIPDMWSPYGHDAIVLTPPCPATTAVIKMWFGHLPDEMTVTGDVMEIPGVFGPAIPTYVVHKALQMTGERPLALQWFQKFLAMVRMLGGKGMPDLPPGVADSS